LSAFPAKNPSINCDMIRNGEVINTNASGIVEHGLTVESGRPYLSGLERNRIDIEGQQYGSYFRAVSHTKKGVVSFEVSILKINRNE
jgi:hypothetical protein